MERKIQINYHWSCLETGWEIPEKHKEALEEDAEKRIFQMLGEGYYQGQLSTTVRFGRDIVPEEDEEDGLNYSGWWSVKRS